jgi:hypothetical protein
MPDLLPPPEEVLKPLEDVLRDALDTASVMRGRLEPAVKFAELTYDLTRLITSVVKIPYEAAETIEKTVDAILKGRL